MRKVTYCTNHRKYTPGCNDCLVQARTYRADHAKRNDETHYQNGQPRKQGAYSDKNWKRFNDLGKLLTNKKEK